MDLVESGEQPTHTYVYPFEYFDAQVTFGLRLAEITHSSPSECLLNSTGLCRRITGSKQHPVTPPDFLLRADSSDRQIALAMSLYDRYTATPHSVYTTPSVPDDGRHFGSFICDYHPDRATIQLHMNNRTRGPKSDFCSAEIGNRRKDMTLLFRQVAARFPDAQTVIMGTWTFNYASFRQIFPAEFIQRLGAPQRLSLRGDSLWGQFVESTGLGNLDRYALFLRRVGKATTRRELLAAFPLPVLFGIGDIQEFHREYES